MDERLKKIIARITVAWKNIDKKKKRIYITGAAAALIIIVVILAVVNTPQYELLYAGGLNSTETAQVYSAVQAQGVSPKVVGTSIYVKKGTAAELRMQLAESGLPQGNLGYDIMSSGSTWAQTDKDKQIQELEQVQNRLQSAIVTITGVNSAIVTIALSNSDDYVLQSDQQPATASVMLNLESGFTLSNKQVNAIVQMVAHSVTGLTADNVSVTDQDGTDLTGGDSGISSASDQLSLQNSYDNAVKAELMPMLQKVYGVGNVDIVANATINFSQTSTVTNTYSSSGVPTSESGSNTITTSGGGASGITGVSGVTTTYPTSSQTGTLITSTSNFSKSYVVGSITQQILDKGGSVQKLTVAVLLNNRVASVSTTDIAGLSKTVANATGANVSDVSIQRIDFLSSSSASSVPAVTWPFLPAGANVLYVIAACALLIIIIITVLMVLLMQHNKKRKKKEQEQLLAKLQAEAQAKADTQQGGKKQLSPLKSIEETIEESQTNSMKVQIEDFADKKPELVAQILKNWLKD